MENAILLFIILMESWEGEETRVHCLASNETDLLKVICSGCSQKDTRHTDVGPSYLQGKKSPEYEN